MLSVYLSQYVIECVKWLGVERDRINLTVLTTVRSNNICCTIQLEKKCGTAYDKQINTKEEEENCVIEM